MAIIEINKKPSRRELNWFGALFATFFGVFGGLIWWKFDAPQVARLAEIRNVTSNLVLVRGATSPLGRPQMMRLQLTVSLEPGVELTVLPLATTALRIRVSQFSISTIH